MRPERYFDPAFARWLREHDRDTDDTDPADDPGECLGECPAWLSYRGEAAPVATTCFWCGKPVVPRENGICATCDAEETRADVQREWEDDGS